MSSAAIIGQIVVSVIQAMETYGAIVTYHGELDKIRVSGLSQLSPELSAKWKTLVSRHRGQIVTFLIKRAQAAEKSAIEAAQRARAEEKIRILNAEDENNYLLSPVDRQILAAVHRTKKRLQADLDHMLDKRAAKQRT